MTNISEQYDQSGNPKIEFLNKLNQKKTIKLEFFYNYSITNVKLPKQGHNIHFLIRLTPTVSE